MPGPTRAVGPPASDAGAKKQPRATIRVAEWGEIGLPGRSYRLRLKATPRQARPATWVKGNVRLRFQLAASLFRLRPLDFALTSRATPSQDAAAGSEPDLSNFVPTQSNNANPGAQTAPQTPRPSNSQSPSSRDRTDACVIPHTRPMGATFRWVPHTPFHPDTRRCGHLQSPSQRNLTPGIRPFGII